MSNVFVVTEIGWEYNDEVYYQPEVEYYPCQPKFVFKDLESARKACTERNVERFRAVFGPRTYSWSGANQVYQTSLFEYSNYGKFSNGDAKEVFNILKELGVETNDDDWWHGNYIPQEISDENVKRLQEAMGVYFYEILEIVDAEV